MKSQVVFGSRSTDEKIEFQRVFRSFEHWRSGEDCDKNDKKSRVLAYPISIRFIVAAKLVLSTDMLKSDGMFGQSLAHEDSTYGHRAHRLQNCTKS